MSTASSHFLSVGRRGLQGAFHCALVEEPLMVDQGSHVIYWAELGPTQPSLRSHVRPRLLLRIPWIGSGMPNRVGGDLLHTMDESRPSRVRTELQSLLIIAFLTPHPVEADGQPAGHRHLGDAPIATHGQTHEGASRGPGERRPGLPRPRGSAPENCFAW
ncbi:MAG: hypothetical protein JWQ49_1214 [Edaphobacter sp.]|nr:hypothetical protein [Edaphobacter sp.]